MCGVFGFITKNGSGPDLDRLRRIRKRRDEIFRKWLFDNHLRLPGHSPLSFEACGHLTADTA